MRFGYAVEIVIKAVISNSNNEWNMRVPITMM